MLRIRALAAAFLAGSTLLVAEPAGAEWKNQMIYPDQNTNLVAAAASGPTHACACGLQQSSGGGSPTVLFFCTYDGEKWTKQTNNSYCSTMMFVDANVGFMGDLMGKIFRTDDGGMTWFKQQGVAFGGSLFNMDTVAGFAVSPDKTTVFAVGAAGSLGWSRDGGTTWEKAAKRVALPAGEDIGVTSIAVLGDTVWIAGGDQGAPEGQDEMGNPIPARPAGLGFLLRSQDGGATFETLVEGHADCFFDIAFVSEEKGFFSGGNTAVSGGVVGRTGDGGATWELASLPDLPDTEVLMPKMSNKTVTECSRVAFFGQKVGAALCSTATLDANGFNALFMTTDGGETWEIQPGYRDGFGAQGKNNVLFVGMPAFDLAMPDCHRAWVIGQGALIHRYSADDQSLDCVAGGAPGADSDADGDADADGGDGGRGNDSCDCGEVGDATAALPATGILSVLLEALFPGL